MNVGPPSVSIRSVTAADAQVLAELVTALARHEAKDATAQVTAATVAGWLFGPEPVCEALLAELDGRPVGYVAFYPGFSLFRGGAVLLVENLYVADSARGNGLGRRLIAAAAAEACRRGIGRIEIHVRGDSQSARAFYEHLGIAESGEFVYRVEDDALAAIAAGGESAP